MIISFLYDINLVRFFFATVFLSLFLSFSELPLYGFMFPCVYLLEKKIERKCVCSNVYKMFFFCPSIVSRSSSMKLQIARTPLKRGKNLRKIVSMNDVWQRAKVWVTWPRQGNKEMYLLWIEQVLYGPSTYFHTDFGLRNVQGGLFETSAMLRVSWEWSRRSRGWSWRFKL